MWRYSRGSFFLRLPSLRLRCIFGARGERERQLALSFSRRAKWMLCYGSGGNSLLLVNEHWGTREGEGERMESGMKDQVQGRARARPLNITTAERASGRREREGGTRRRRRQFIFALKVTPKAAARCPFVSRCSLYLAPSACKRIDGVVCMDGVGSRRRGGGGRALNLWTSGSRSERGDGRTNARTDGPLC